MNIKQRERWLKHLKNKNKKVKRLSNKGWKKKYKKYLLSDEWAKIKIELLEFRGEKCERCLNSKNLQVHHLTYKNIFNEEPEDLEILCKSCHRKEHNLK